MSETKTRFEQVSQNSENRREMLIARKAMLEDIVIHLENSIKQSYENHLFHLKIAADILAEKKTYEHLLKKYGEELKAVESEIPKQIPINTLIGGRQDNHQRNGLCTFVIDQEKGVLCKRKATRKNIEKGLFLCSQHQNKETKRY